MGNKQQYYAPSDFSQAGGFIDILEFFQGLTMSGLFNTLITTIAILFFFWSIVSYIWKLRTGSADDNDKKRIAWSIVLIAVIFSVYGLIYITRNIFGLQNTGVNQSVPFRRVNF